MSHLRARTDVAIGTTRELCPGDALVSRAGGDLILDCSHSPNAI
jgi:hypothetical protein